MELSYDERIGRAIKLLTVNLIPKVEERLSDVKGSSGDGNLSDPYTLLTTLKNNWDRYFGDFPKRGWTYVHLILHGRNEWAHEEDVDERKCLMMICVCESLLIDFDCDIEAMRALRENLLAAPAASQSSNDETNYVATQAVPSQKETKLARARQTSSAGALPARHALVVIGHRPDYLGGYKENSVARGIYDRLKTIIGERARNVENLVVVRGLDIGAEMMGACVARELNVAYDAVLPFPDRDEHWSQDNSALFQSLKSDARNVMEITPKLTDRSECHPAHKKRKAWVMNNVSEAVAVSDGSDKFLTGYIDELKSRLGNDKVFLVNPQDFRS